MNTYEGIRVPVVGETWIYLHCLRHGNPTDFVSIGRAFEHQNERSQRAILSQILHGCFRVADGLAINWDVDKSK